MSKEELELNPMFKRLLKISASGWVAIKFEKQIPAADIESIRFCQAAYRAQSKHISYSGN